MFPPLGSHLNEFLLNRRICSRGTCTAAVVSTTRLAADSSRVPVVTGLPAAEVEVNPITMLGAPVLPSNELIAYANSLAHRQFKIVAFSVGSVSI